MFNQHFDHDRLLSLVIHSLNDYCQSETWTCVNFESTLFCNLLFHFNTLKAGIKLTCMTENLCKIQPTLGMKTGT